MLRRALLAVIALVTVAGCNRGSGQGTIPADPIRNEREPGEASEYHSAVPESSGGADEASGDSSTEGETEIEIEEDAASTETGESKDEEKSESSDDESDDGGEIEIEIEP